MLCATTADLEQDDHTSFYIFNVDQSQSAVNQPIGIPRHGLQPLASVFSSPPRLQPQKNHEGTCDIPQPKYSQIGGPKAFECPSIQITSISPNCQQELEANEDELQANGPENDYTERTSRDHLYLPLDPSYRDASLSPSPASSISSRSWFSDASSCESFSHVYDDVDSELNEAAARFNLGSPLASPGGSPRGCPGDESWQAPYTFGPTLSPRQSPCHSPRTSITDENWLSPRPPSRPSSRPTSPCGKRRHSSADICYIGSLSPHHSPTPSPGHSPRGSVTDDTWLGNNVHSGQGFSPGLSPFHCHPAETDIPLKSRKTSQDQTTILSGKVDLTVDDQGGLSPSLESSVDDGSGAQHSLKKDLSGEQFLSVPSHFTWNKPKPGHTPIFRTSSLPPLDWPLPCQYGQYELKIEVQPKTHHRAHYETEGSRGAVKASSGGHPVVKLQGYSEKPVNLQMFIGTADDRYLRPHAFYQVHRITGKTVATASQEIIIASTKVLEIPLLPENNMSASIDCAGILKLRNSDIELRKGETDIGRKNTRVRLVFRVHIPQPSGKVLSLQAASIPVECSQRSAQELPQIEKYSISSSLVNGGEEMVVTGSNFLPESKIIFLEKGPDGRPQWEVEGKVMREKCQGSNIVVEVPPYHSKTVTSAVQVQFYVCNGKRKRSQSQRFTYMPVLLKQEHRDELDLHTVSPLSMSMPHTASFPIGTQLPSPDPGHQHDNLLSTSPRSLVHSMQQPYTPMVPSPVQHMPHLQGRSISPGAECHIMTGVVHQSFQAAPAPSVRPSYQTMQSNMMYNGQSGLPMNSAPNQGYDRISFQPDCSPVTHSMNLGCQPVTPMTYQSSNVGPVSSVSSAAGHHLTHPSHSGQSSPHLQPIGYHCSNTGQTSSPSTTGQPLGQPPPQLQPISYCSSNPGSAPSSSPTASHPLAHSPHSGPSSPQMQPMPYQSPNRGPVSSPSSTAANSVVHSGQPTRQAHSPGLAGLPVPSSLGCDPPPFPPDRAVVNIKQEPEDGELNFQTIGLQDITLDDVNEIIGRDMSQLPTSHGAVAASQSPHGCPGPLETGMHDEV
ncbi:nuclear factor of activated T-cells, cytoplasmic 3 isoform X2 [Latimeria chalumnae]|uniref:nuclear factor of activated T-cells, cytoplasmic 3 isoform X2 n=1 Tax=Latimeria chalumnae TaxID=7897 RepID=UPI0006D93D16|nr:PREDICTED: nuclear factor of activated T-cells, cytoplasmic 3 [Latimeria chalumnae]|eukprot:XP_014339353.1 PREDICTED: nuclear factor of activated T-cells, cytoplasmic 3 [Latimeria chalumnae]